MRTQVVPGRSTDGPRPGRSLTALAVAVGLVAVVLLVGFLGWRIVRGADTRSVAVFGDSITELAQDPLHQRFDPTYEVTVSGVSGARTDQRIADAAALAATHPDQVIVDLGTNDVLQDTPTDESADALTQVGTAFDTASCIHLVTVNESMVDLSRPQLHDHAVALNQRIRGLAAQHGWNVIDWAGIVARYDAAGDPEGPITTDTVHPTPVGQRLLLDAYDEALRGCTR